MKTEKYSPNWLLEKIESSKTETHKLLHIIEFQNQLIRELKQGQPLPSVENTDKEKLNLIKALYDYVHWYGCRDRKTDKILPIKQQEGIVVTAMTLLKKLT